MLVYKSTKNKTRTEKLKLQTYEWGELKTVPVEAGTGQQMDQQKVVEVDFQVGKQQKWSCACQPADNI